MKDTKEENALLIPSIDIVAKAYDSEESLEAILSAIETECRAEHYSVATREGRDRIKSQAYKIARSKTAMDDVGKGLTEEANNLIKRINGRRKVVTTRLDALKDEIRAPLTAWEDAEDRRKKEIKDRIGSCFGMRALPASSAVLRALQDQIIAIELDESWQEFLEEATKAKDNFLRHLAGKIHEAERAEEREKEIAAEREAQAKELARLRELDDQRRKEAAERAAEEERLAKIQAEKDAEIAKLRAELDAMRQQPMPAPVGIVGAEVTHVVVDEVQSYDQVEKIDMPPRGDNFTTIAKIAPNPSIEASIKAAILAVIEECETQEAAAAEVASAIMSGQIPFVEVSA